MPGFAMLSPQQLSRLIGTPQCPAILDVRTAEDFALDPFLIPTSRHCAATDLAALHAAVAGRWAATAAAVAATGAGAVAAFAGAGAAVTGAGAAVTGAGAAVTGAGAAVIGAGAAVTGAGAAVIGAGAAVTGAGAGAGGRAAGALQSVVVLCQRGRKLSEGAAALLRAEGIAAEVLEGGWLAWRTAGLPALPAALLPAPGQGTLWVTRQRPKIDRIACPWLIRRFIDPGARFLFVAPSEVAAVASIFGATPFDIEGVTLSHRGEMCSFDALLDDFNLHTEALDRLARVVRGADTDRHDLAPQAAGLLALSVGLSRQYRDDLEQLGAGMIVYDALYRWARDGADEGHDWPAGRKA